MRHRFEYSGKTGQTTIFKKKQNLKNIWIALKLCLYVEKIVTTEKDGP